MTFSFFFLWISLGSFTYNVTQYMGEIHLKTLLSFLLTGTFPLKNPTRRDKCVRKGWWISAQVSIVLFNFRSKPFKYTYEKEIVMYAYFKKLDYFSTECIYSPNAYRGHARTFIKDLEKIRQIFFFSFFDLFVRTPAEAFAGGGGHSRLSEL